MIRENDVEEGDAVEVIGTVRQFDLTEAEQLFDVELDDAVYDSFEDEMVIIADRVSEQPSAGDSTTTTAG